MVNLLAQRTCEKTLSYAYLDKIWYVNADATYQIPKLRGWTKNAYVAVRTVAGEGKLTLWDGTSLYATAASLILLKTDDLSYYCTCGDKWQFYWIEYDMEVCDLSLLRLVFNIPLSADEQGLLERSFRCLAESTDDNCRVAESIVNMLLADWKTRVVCRHGEKKQPDMKDLLEKGRCEHKSVLELAREAGMSERSFRNAVQSLTGLSPKAYMLKSEMEAAMELLRTTNMTITEIAMCFNYTDPLYFSRVFKNYFGLSPKHVRNGIRL